MWANKVSHCANKFGCDEMLGVNFVFHFKYNKNFSSK